MRHPPGRETTGVDPAEGGTFNGKENGHTKCVEWVRHECGHPKVGMLLGRLTASDREQEEVSAEEKNKPCRYRSDESPHAVPNPETKRETRERAHRTDAGGAYDRNESGCQLTRAP